MEGVRAPAGVRLGARRARLAAVRCIPMVHRALASALRHDGLYLAQSAAYSALVSLFPALIVSAAAIALLPEVAPLKVAIGAFFDQVLPVDVFPLLNSYFTSSPNNLYTRRALVLAAVVSLTGASSVLATLMEGLRRAEELPRDCWTFGQRRLRALVLVPLSLAPLLLATVLVIFGRFLTIWMAGYLSPLVQPTFFRLAATGRWVAALGGVVGVTALVYQLGTPKPQRWTRMLPGATVATVMWFATTLAFGWYVTRFANYSQVYGPLGAGIALLFWLYIVFLSLLCGAEFNAQFYRQFFLRESADRGALPEATD